MRERVEIENIEEKRRRVGIEDVELREEIRGLRAGDFVNLTFLADSHASETLSVRITSIRGPAFRGKLTDSPTSAALAGLRAGSLVVFTRAHIHSLAKRRPGRRP
jgi:hypothetical protein